MLNSLFLVIYLIILYINLKNKKVRPTFNINKNKNINKKNILNGFEYVSNHLMKGGHLISRSIPSYSIMPFISEALLVAHDDIHKLMNYSDYDKGTDEIPIKKEIEKRKEANNKLLYLLNKTEQDNKTKLYLNSKIAETNEILDALRGIQ